MYCIQEHPVVSSTIPGIQEHPVVSSTTPGIQEHPAETISDCGEDRWFKLLEPLLYILNKNMEHKTFNLLKISTLRIGLVFRDKQTPTRGWGEM